MNKNRFKDLLTDLYEKYNPEHLKYIEELVQRNHDSPYAAIDSIFMKYNHKSMHHFDPVKSTDEYKVELLKEYEEGKRTFKEVDLTREASLRKEVAEKQENTSEVEKKKAELELVEQKAEEAVKKTLTNIDEAVSKSIEEATKKAMDDIAKSMNDGVDYTVTIDDVGDDVILPNKRHLAALGINARLIVRGKSGRPIGLVIKDIAYDSFTSEKNVIVSIHLEKG